MSFILITGGAGFIGSHLSKKLIAAGHRVRILDNLSAQIHGQVPEGLDWLKTPDVEFIRGSVTHVADVARAIDGVEVVIHLAAETGTGQSMYQIAHYTAVNVGGTAILMDAITNSTARTVKRLVLASSRSVYGEGAYVCRACHPDVRQYPGSRSREQLAAHRWEHACQFCGQDLEPVPTREDDRTQPASIYAATKLAQEDLVRVCGEALGIEYAILRLQNVYGEGQSLNNPYTGILSIFSSRIRRGQILPIFEDGMESRDFIHVSDVAEAFQSAADHAKSINSVINIGAGVSTPITEVARQLTKAFDANENQTTTNEYRIGDIRHNFAEILRMEKILGLSNLISITEGLQRFSGWALTQPLGEDRLAKANSELKSKNLMG